MVRFRENGRVSHISQLRTEVVARVAPALPRPLREKLVPPRYSWSYADLAPRARAGEGEVRALIAPANYASQGFYWARAAETLPGVSCVNLAFGWAPGVSSIEPDYWVHGNVGKHSHLWARRQRKAILQEFTHVLYEAERPILGGLYDGDVAAEIRDLQAHGIKVAMISHGSDIRTPSRHVELEEFSPFVAPLDGLTEALEIKAGRNHALLDRVDLPLYASTADLLLYRPEAIWLPTLTDPERWLALPPSQFWQWEETSPVSQEEGLPPTQGGQQKPVVLHVPSKSALKGTASIASAMRKLEEEGYIEYLEAEKVPYTDMPDLVSKADVVIDQVSMGLYGVASVEAMLAGRIVVAQAGQHIRDHIARETGWDLPIVEANPDTVYDVVRDIARHPERYRDRIEQGRAFATEVHSQERVAKALRPFLLG